MSDGAVATLREIEDEQRRARYVRVIVDLTAAIIMQSRMSRHEAEALIRAARQKVLQLFPGREETYELLYAPRFSRLLDEFTRTDLQLAPPAVVIPVPDARS